MAHLVEDITKYFQFEDIDIDNWSFKLFSKGCVILFFAGSMVGVMSQYFGEPIQCDFKGIDGETAKDFCWIHGSSYIPPQHQRHMRCIADLEGVNSKEDAPDTSYYQWVTFVQLGQAGLHMLPARIWRSLEGGLLASFGQEGKSVVMLTEEARYEDGIVMEVITEKFVKYFRSILHHNNIYFVNFVMCEIANIVLVFFNFWCTDQFLQGRFRYFGYNVIHYYSLSRHERDVAVNPFCAVFPKEISCDVPAMGPSGGQQTHNGLCVLSQNVINEKMYLVLWFYMIFVMVYSIYFIFYRLVTILFEPIRFYLIFSRIKNSEDTEIRISLRKILSQCYLGDWFVLHQLCRNVNVYFYRTFVKELRKELRRSPKGRRDIMLVADCETAIDGAKHGSTSNGDLIDENQLLEDNDIMGEDEVEKRPFLPSQSLMKLKRRTLNSSPSPTTQFSSMQSIHQGAGGLPPQQQNHTSQFTRPETSEAAKRSANFLRIEHEHRLMPNLRRKNKKGGISGSMKTSSGGSKKRKKK